MSVCVLFDLDETVLDRTASLKAFASWQAHGMLRGQLQAPSVFVQRFLELDNSGTVWKDVVYEKLIEEFNIKHWTVTDLLQSYELCFCAFCVCREGIPDTLERLSKRGIGLGLVDIKGAHDAGMKTVYVPSVNNRKPCALADRTVSDAKLLSDAIDSLLG